MLDYYSDIPAPSYLAEKATMRHNYRKKNPHAEKYISSYEEEDILDKVFGPHLSLYGDIKYSYVGWYADVRREVEYYYNSYMDSIKRERIRLRLRVLFKLSVMMLKWHHESKERMYHPDSDFVKNVLKKQFYEY